MSGIIGIPCNESARFSETYSSIMGMHLPKDWSIVGSGARMPVAQCRYASLAASLNFIGQAFIKSKAEWLFLLNDDHVYPPDILLRLLSHNKDFITGLYLKKQLPFEPILYDREDEHGRLIGKALKPYESGLIRILGCGDGCLLIRRTVLENIPYPWWEMSNPQTPDLITQDLIFCKKVREAGFEMWADLDATVGHLAIIPVFPQCVGGQWSTVLLSGQDDRIVLQAAQAPQEALEAVEV